ncbi:uncharacterized protein ACR2FA_010942 [Aphomia sociella]
MNITVKDNNTNIYCIKFDCVENAASVSCSRNVTKHTVFRSTIYKNEDGAALVPIISVTIVLIILVILLFWLWKRWMKCNRSNKEEFHANPNLQYAELQTMNAPTNSHTVKNDIEYSKIIGVMQPKKANPEVHYEEIRINSADTKKEERVYEEIKNITFRFPYTTTEHGMGFYVTGQDGK